MTSRLRSTSPRPHLDSLDSYGLRLSIDWSIMEASLGCGANNHCATVAAHPLGALIAFYTGRECGPDQRVVVVLWDSARDVYIPIAALSSGTGNPVLWAEPDGTVGMLFSQFEGKNWWTHCRLWTMEFGPASDSWDNGIRSSIPVPFPANIGLVGRCPPIWSARGDGALLMPLYHERPAWGVLYRRRKPGGPWKWWATIGRHNDCLMQPAIWYDQGRYWALCRSTKPRELPWALMSSSDNARGRWGSIWASRWPNQHNSIVVIPDGDNTQVVWNEEHRRKLMIGPVHGPELGGVQLNPTAVPHASYPNWAWVGRDLHLVWTQGVGTRKIVHRIMKDFKKT